MNRIASHGFHTSTLSRRFVHSPVGRTIVRTLPPRLTISLQFYYRLGYFPNLRRPATFNEKIQHRKLYDRDPRMAPLIDKIAAKDIVAGVIGSDWIIPTLWSGRDPAHIPFDKLTPPYVVKASHTSNCNLFVFDGEAVDRAHIQAQAARWLKVDHASYAHEWAYSQVSPGLLIEPYIGRITSLPVDLKFYVFHGKVHYIEVCVDRGTENKRWIYFDRDWVWQPVSPADEADADMKVNPPESLTAMIDAAEALGAPFGFARVDFYEVDERPLFGEITFYPDAGYDSDHSANFNRVLGELWRL